MLFTVLPTHSYCSELFNHQFFRCGFQVVGRLLAAHADLHFRDEHQACPLHEAAAKGHAAVLRQLLAAGAAVAAVDCEGKEALHWAASRGHVEAAKVLLKANAQVGWKKM